MVNRDSDCTVVITGVHWHLTLVYNCEETPPDDGIMSTFVLALATIAYFDGHRQYLMSHMCTRVHWGIPQDEGKATRVYVHVYVQLNVDASQFSGKRVLWYQLKLRKKTLPTFRLNASVIIRANGKKCKNNNTIAYTAEDTSLDVFRGQRSVTIASPNLSPHQCGPAQNLQPLFRSYHISSAAASRKSRCPCIVVSEVLILLIT